MHAKLWKDVDGAIDAFFQDLREHNAADDTIMLIWTEFGRRVKDNGSGTDHGAGGVAIVIGEHVKGGQYGAFPSLRDADLTQQREGMFGNLRYSYDFRGLYSTIVDRWLGLDGTAIVGGPVRTIGLRLKEGGMSTNIGFRYAHTIGLLAQTGRGFSLPVDCALGPEGVLYVLNRGTPTQRNTHVTICTVDGEYRTDFGSYGTGDGQFIWPTAIAVDREGYVYISSESEHRIQKFSPTGQFISKWGTLGDGDGEFDGPAEHGLRPRG